MNDNPSGDPTLRRRTASAGTYPAFCRECKFEIDVQMHPPMSATYVQFCSQCQQERIFDVQVPEAQQAAEAIGSPDQARSPDDQPVELD